MALIPITECVSNDTIKSHGVIYVTTNPWCFRTGTHVRGGYNQDTRYGPG